MQVIIASARMRRDGIYCSWVCVCVCVCVCLLGVIEEKGREKGEKGK